MEKVSALKRVIVDFDNTMGVRGCDLDDGLSLLYLIGCEGVAIEAICTTYGNNQLDVVHDNTLRMVAEWGIDAPVYRGAASADQPESDAACAIARILGEAAGEVHLLATGSMTNLRGAKLVDPQALDGAASICVMGGITESLVINGRIMDELNFSCDAAATADMLSAAAPVSVATAQNCLPAYFKQEDLTEWFGADSWLHRACAYWFDCMDDEYAWDAWVCWDVVAAAYLIHPELFVDQPMSVSLNETMLGIGFLEQAPADAPQAAINAPVIKDQAAFKAHVLETWKCASEKLLLK